MLDLFVRSTYYKPFALLVSFASLFLAFASTQYLGPLSIPLACSFLFVTHYFYAQSCHENILLSDIAKIIMLFFIFVLLSSFLSPYLKTTRLNFSDEILYGTVLLIFSPAHQLRVTPQPYISLKEYLEGLCTKRLFTFFFIAVSLMISSLTALFFYVFNLSLQAQYLLCTDPKIHYVLIILYFSMVSLFPYNKKNKNPRSY